MRSRSTTSCGHNNDIAVEPSHENHTKHLPDLSWLDKPGGMGFTVRKCITEMRKVDSTCIVTNNGTKIMIEEIHSKPSDQPFSIIKGPDMVMRRILCRIIAGRHTVMIDSLKKNPNDYWMYDGEEYGFFSEDEFMLPERVMNEFIRANGEINYYDTIGAHADMISDMESVEW